MPNYKVINTDQLDADLAAIADAIRAKGGTSDALAFPNGFKSAVEAIETGSGDNTKKTVTVTVTNNMFYDRFPVCYLSENGTRQNIPWGVTATVEALNGVFAYTPSSGGVSYTGECYLMRPDIAVEIAMFVENGSTLTCHDGQGGASGGGGA